MGFGPRLSGRRGWQTPGFESWARTDAGWHRGERGKGLMGIETREPTVEVHYGREAWDAAHEDHR